MHQDNTKRILIIDDHQLFADGLALILRGISNHLEVAIQHDAILALNDRDALTQYDLILVDLHMPTLNGFAFLTAIQSQKMAVPVAIVSGTERNSEIERALALGAVGYIPKDSSSQEMTHAVSKLLKGERYLPKNLPAIDERALAHSPVSSTLTDRQLRVLELMRDGLQNKQIGLVLGISTYAVKGDVEKLFRNFHVNNRTSCVKIAQQSGVL